jgi:hypothetical protein
LSDILSDCHRLALPGFCEIWAQLGNPSRVRSSIYRNRASAFAKVRTAQALPI